MIIFTGVGGSNSVLPPYAMLTFFYNKYITKKMQQYADCILNVIQKYFLEI